jgi:beta-glucosidase
MHRVLAFALSLAAAVPVLAQPNEAEVRRKVDGLIAQMTLEEKVGQLTQLPGYNGANPEVPIRKAGAGSVLWMNNPAEINKVQRVAMEESRLKIPVIFAFDVIHGYRTVFPVPLAMASSWDPSLVERAQAVAAKEARTAGLSWTFAPMVDIARDARWGRIVEGAGEDPYLGSAIAAAQVRGFQGPYLGAPDHVLACVKHFATYGAAEGGRDYDSTYVPETQLRNVYFPPFQAALKAGVGSLMSAYMELNDVPVAGNHWMLTDVLRGEWAFKGFVVSDAFAVNNLVVQHFARDPKDAAFRAFSAGLNMDMASNTYLGNLAAVVKEGKITIAQIDEAVRPILAAKVRLGLFEHPYADEAKVPQVMLSPEHRQEARSAAQRSMVLLRNEGNVLPLPKSLTSLAVIGRLADSKSDTEGSWLAFEGEPSATTVLEGLKAKLPSAKITYAPGPEVRRIIPSFFDEWKPPKKPALTAEENEAAYQKALETARGADVVVMVLGEVADMSGEAASRASLDLPGRQEELLEAVVGLGKRVVLVLINGRPLSINWASEHVPAILEAWQPGTEGGNAVADILFGDVNPGGKLPVTFPRSGGQEPTYYAHNLTFRPENTPDYKYRYSDEKTAPIFPFGHGLSYTTFAYANLKVSAPQVKVGGTAQVSVDVTNSGDRAGDEVVQLYIHQKAGVDTHPIRQLKGFRRIALDKGQTQTLTFPLGPDELRYWSTSQRKWMQDTEAFDVWVGGDSRATLHADLSVVP